MSAARGRGFLLPPRPRLRDWPLAGAGAGCLVAACELAVAALGEPLRAPGSLIAALVAYHALGGALLASLTALALRSQGIRLCYSATAGALIGVQAALLALDALFSAVTVKQGPATAVAVATFALSAALGAGALVATLGERLERSGLPLHAPAVWLGSALLLALVSAVRGGSAAYGIGAAAVLALAPGAAWLLLRMARNRGVHARTQLGALGATAVIGVAALAGAYAALPWLRYADAHTGIPEGPPSVVLVSADPGLAREAREAAAELIGWNGVRYRASLSQDAAGVSSLVRLADGRTLASALREKGYVSASVHAAGAPPESSAFAEVDAGGSPLGALARREPGLRGLAWLRCCAKPLASALRFDAPRRSTAELTRAASAWLLDWRTRRAQTPFVLWVDYRGAEGGGDALVAALASLLHQLDQHEVGPRALLMLALADPGRDRVSFVVRPPEGWAVPDRPSRAPHRLRETELGEALFAAVGSRTARPALPGLDEPGAS
jgi:hypothetical protein